MPLKQDSNDNMVSTNKLSKRINKKKLFGIIIIFLVTVVSLSIFYIFRHKDSNQSVSSGDASIQIPEDKVIYNQDPLNSTSPTGESLESEVAKAKVDIEKLNAEIKAIPKPTDVEAQVSLATKYLRLGNLYIIVFDYPNASNALSRLYDTNVISVDTLFKNQQLNMDAQGAFGLLYYNSGKYSLALESYNRALAIASYKNANPNSEVFSPSDVVKYQEAINTIKAKM